MPANSTHFDYDSALAAWQRARDVIAGEDAVKAGGERYLPRLDAQSDSEYRAYKSRACFFNATSRTCHQGQRLAHGCLTASEQSGPGRHDGQVYACCRFPQRVMLETS